MRNIVSTLQDPSLVCRFQSYFGVIKLAEVENDKKYSWVATEVKGKYAEIEKDSTENHNGIRSSKIKDVSNGNGHVCTEDTKEKNQNIVYYRVSLKAKVTSGISFLCSDLQQVLVSSFSPG